jgi:cytosine/adenosine deaminase-related metal-dependent hydrolase
MVSGDMFNVMRIGLDHQRSLDSQQARRDGKGSETYAINGSDALEWATVGGARALMLEDRIGTLTPGKQADIVLIRATDINLVPVKYPVESVVFHANASNVDTVLIAGTAVKRHGELTIPDLSGKLQALTQSSQHILETAGIH